MLCLVLLLLAALGVGGGLGQPVPSSPRSGRGLPRPACRLSGLPAGPGVRPAQRYLWPGQCPAAGRPGPGQARDHPPDGDLADSRRTNLAVALSFARQAAAIAPVYYVPGNHEARLAQYTAFAAALEAAGVQVLANRALPLVRGGGRITIAGLADPGLAQRAGDPRPAEAILGDALAALRLSSQPFPLLLAHRPEWFPLYAEGGAALVFSGHAHGGQVRLPGIGGLFAPGAGPLPPGTTGGLPGGGRPGWWSAGGWATASSPLRVGNRPEVVVATLHPAPSVEGQ